MAVKGKIIPGPDADQPFRVITGIAVVFTVEYSFPIPAGSTWPGRLLLPELLPHVQAEDIQLLPGTTLSVEVSEEDLRAGNALAHVVALMKGSLSRRYALLIKDVEEQGNRGTLAGALSVTREYLSSYDMPQLP
ncbi:hypothetical protein [Deinococcus sp. UYEF24]